MLKYIVKRLIMLVPVVLGITFILFIVLSLAPGDPAFLILGVDASAEQIAEQHAKMGLDRPVLVQYARYIGGLFRGDMGTSWITGRDVAGEFFLRLPNTLLVAVLATLLAISIGIPMGIISAIRQNRPFDYSAMVFAMLLFSIPAFWLGLMCQILFGLILGWLPAAGTGSWKHFVLPAIVLGANTLAAMIRMSRSSMLDVIRQDYVRTARAKGLPEHLVIMHHALRNGMMPVVTQVGISFATSIGGAVITEIIFAIPGIGSLLVNAVVTRDIPIVMGMLVFISVIVGVINLLVDVLCAKIDPRIDLAS